MTLKEFNNLKRGDLVETPTGRIAKVTHVWTSGYSVENGNILNYYPWTDGLLVTNLK